mgnify:FL=1
MMSELTQITAANYLSKRLESFSESAKPSVDTSSDPNSSTLNSKLDKADLTISASDTSYLLLKDTVDNYSNMTSLVQVSKSSLSTIGDFLTAIKSKLFDLKSTTEGSDERKALNLELNDLENKMSKYISTVIVRASQSRINISPIGSEVKEKYFDTVVNNGQFGSVEADMLAKIEVNLAHMVDQTAGNHNPAACPICASQGGAVESGSLSGAGRAIGPGSDTVTVADGAGTSTANLTGYIASAGHTGTTNIDALMGGPKWDLSAAETMSYSYYKTSGVVHTYMLSTGTAGNSLIASAGTETTLDTALNYWDEAGAWTFEKINESGNTVGEIRLRGTTESSSTNSRSAYAYFPNNGVTGGDAWFTKEYSGPFEQGNFNYYTVLHEVGHAIGLSHTFGGASSSGKSLGEFDDIIRRSVMSYTTVDRNKYWATSGGSLSVSTIYAETPGIFDVQAIEYMYGTSTNTNLGNTTYSYDDKPVMMRTIVDSGGTDTIDASNQTEAVTINLNGGTASSIGQWERSAQIAYYVSQGFNSATLQSHIDNASAAASSGATHGSPYSDGWYEGQDNLMIAISSVIENAKGGAKADTITGNSSSNQITGNGGDDVLDGGAGTDYAVYAGLMANYTITGNGTSASVTANSGSNSADGTDSLSNFEFVRFSDQDYDLSTGVANIISWQNTEPDYTKAYKPVVRKNGSINVSAFPVLAKLNFSQLQSVATGKFTGDAKALFTEGLKTDAEIADALDALDELLKQISEQQTIIASAQASINQNANAAVNSNNTGTNPGVISQALVAEVEEAGFVAELMVAIRAQIQGIINAQVTAVAPSSDQEVISLLA